MLPGTPKADWTDDLDCIPVNDPAACDVRRIATTYAIRPRQDCSMGNGSTAPALDDYQSLDVRQLARDGYLEEGHSKRLWWRVDGKLVGPIAITAGSTFVDICDPDPPPGRSRFGASVLLTETSVTYGTRRWFTCPECDRRCALLYVEDTENIVCRVCLGAPYLSATLGKSARLQDRREKARRALFMDAAGQIHKPKGMHLTTWLDRRMKLWAIEEEIARDLWSRDA